MFSIQHKIGDFHKDFYIKETEKLAHHRSYYKILGKHHVADVRHKAFESTPGAQQYGSVSAKMLFCERLFNKMLSTKCFPQNAGKSLWGKRKES